MWRLIFVTTSLVVLVGCMGTVHDYPSDWSPVVTDKNTQCPDISGVYENRAVPTRTWLNSQVTECVRAECYLGARLHPEFDELASPNEHERQHSKLLRKQYSVELTQHENGGLGVRVMNNDVVVDHYEREVGRKGFSCEDGTYRWADRNIEGASLGVGVGRASVKLGVSEDQSLVLERVIDMGGLFTVLPIGAHSNEWYRWRRRK
jgi:hypothetical protein